MLPEDLKKLSYPELEELAKEIRKQIIDVMAINGGHLASNLGVVELSIAMHYVFNSPTDKFIFDVGHQTYPHKILTGRAEEFSTIRKFKGLCGFSHPKESEYDHFHAGHAGTALSLGLGLAKNRDLAGRDEHILPFLGDASLTCGLTYEALNNIPRHLKRFIVILNDNKMSIANNVGAITNILSRIVNHPKANRTYQNIGAFLHKIPSWGNGLARVGHRLTESMKNLVSAAPFFEQFGLWYIGPIDGHDIKKCIETFKMAANSNRSMVIHFMTKKGQGLESAEGNPISFHGCKPFDKVSGKFHASSGKPTFPKIFGKHLFKMAETDPSVVAISPATPVGASLVPFMEKFPDRCIDVGIAEGHAVTYAGGIAYGKKMKVVASLYSTFLQRAMDNLFHDVCLQKLPVLFAVDRAGIAGADGASHNGIYDIAHLNAMPNMIIAQPRNGKILRELMESAFSWNRPAAIRYPNLTTDEGDDLLEKREPATAEVLAVGKDLLIVALGHMCDTALQVREKLLEQGIKATVIDPIFIKPLDTETFTDALLSHKLVVTIEEHAVSSGLGSIINNFILQNQMQNSVINCGIPDTFVEHGSHKELTKELGLDADSITKRILAEMPEREGALI